MSSFRPASHPKSFVALGMVVLGAFFGLILQNELLLNYVVSLALIAVLIPLLFVIGVIALVNRFRGKRMGSRMRWTASIAASTILAIIVFSFVWGRIDLWKNNAVKKYVALVVPGLDQMKAQSGDYPLEIPATFPTPPELLRLYGGYSSDGKDFQFEYIDAPVGWAVEGAWVFTSKDRKWLLDRGTESPKDSAAPKEPAK